MQYVRESLLYVRRAVLTLSPYAILIYVPMDSALHYVFCNLFPRRYCVHGCADPSISAESHLKRPMGMGRPCPCRGYLYTWQCKKWGNSLPLTVVLPIASYLMGWVGGWVHLHLLHPADLPCAAYLQGVGWSCFGCFFPGVRFGEQLLGNCYRVCWVPLGTPGSVLPRSSMHLPTHCCLVPLEKISLEMLDGVPCGFPLLRRVLCVMIRISLMGKKQMHFMYKAKNSLLVSLKTG